MKSATKVVKNICLTKKIYEIMTKFSKRYSIRVNGQEIIEYQSIQKTVRLFNTLSRVLSKNDTVCVYDRGTMTYLY